MELSGPIFALIMGIIIALIVLGIVINYVYILFVENPRREGHSKTFMEKVAINWRDFKRFIWDIKKGEIFGRTPLSWFLIIVYLAFLYTIVFGLFALLLWLRLRYLPDLKDGPYRTDYLTFDGPGISVVPYGRKKEYVFQYNRRQPGTFRYFLDRRTQFLLDYITVDGEDQTALFLECRAGTIMDQRQCGQVPEDDRAFYYFEAADLLNSNGTRAYNLYNLGDCWVEDGFERAEPCFLMTVNKVWDWKPSKLRVNSRKDERWIGELDQYDSRFLPIICQGVRQEDRDDIAAITIYPRRGFDIAYFPWRDQKNYRPPIVAVQVKVAPSGINKNIRVECVLLADNIFHRSQQPNAGRTELRIRVSD
ncbi:sodium/potassium-transporting ATPase subunit beta-1-like [Symsagittifera roscoffensis]|uniref:sodium/potassium-transporting ATPase subunit beta-1-like n=1 Tax=Symsagittifera roscoffensis TaxID=84072 RepID=UPI00307B40C4